jgi:hypothetical protein
MTFSVYQTTAYNHNSAAENYSSQETSKPTDAPPTPLLSTQDLLDKAQSEVGNLKRLHRSSPDRIAFAQSAEKLVQIALALNKQI